MVKLVCAKCPSCGAALKLAKAEEKVKCEYCHQTIIVDDAIACYKLKISGTVSVDGIQTNSDLITAANELLNMDEYLKAKKKFLEFSEKCPDDYQGWLGLLICRTRNFTIKDNNIMFENDIDNYYKHFLKTSPEDVKKQYVETIENYLHPKIDEEVIKKTVKESTKKALNFKIDPKYKPYIAPAILIFCGIALLSDAIIVGGIFFLIAGIVQIPKVKVKLKLTKKLSIIISVICAIIGFIAFGIENPAAFVGKWSSWDSSYTIEFVKNGDFTYSTEDSKKITGTYTYSYENNVYMISISTSDETYNKAIFKYDNNAGSSKKLCLYENDACTIYFK